METGAEHRVAAADGVSLFVREYPALGAANGLPVLLLHGLTRNSRDFERVGPRIAALGRRAMALDVRGRGRSGYDEDPARYSVPVYAQDVLAVMAALEAPRAVFVGTSMGGLITMALAAAAPQAVAGAVLNDVGARLEGAGLARIGAYVGRDMEMADWPAAIAAVKASQGHAFPGADEAFWARFAARVCRELPDGRVGFDYDANIALAIAETAPDASVDLSALFAAMAPKPVLLVRGALSDLLSPEGVALSRALKPDLESLTVEGVGHAPTLEEPEAWEGVLDFLARAP